MGGFQVGIGGFRPAWVALARCGPCVVVGCGWSLVLVASHGSGSNCCQRSRSEWVALDRRGNMGEWVSSWHGWLQTSVGGFSSAWAMCGGGAWVAISGRRCSWLVVGRVQIVVG